MQFITLTDANDTSKQVVVNPHQIVSMVAREKGPKIKTDYTLIRTTSIDKDGTLFVTESSEEIAKMVNKLTTIWRVETNA